jgi:ABC-type uncharacterized transport system ATPase subunit
VIRLENVSVEYRLKAERVLALREVNLDIAEGSFDAVSRNEAVQEAYMGRRP